MEKSIEYGNTISRTDMLDAIGHGTTYSSEDLQKIINDLPSVQPKVKTGHWIRTGDYHTGAYGSIEYVKCSCCGEDSLEEGDFCPNCGAKMVEPQGKRCADCNHYGKLSLDCSRCDDDCSMFESRKH